MKEKNPLRLWNEGDENNNLKIVEKQNLQAPKFLISTKYLLIGGGTASYAAMKAIQEREPSAGILLISEEDYIPYMRPPLSKEMWSSEKPMELAFRDWNEVDRR